MGIPSEEYDADQCITAASAGAATKVSGASHPVVDLNTLTRAALFGQLPLGAREILAARAAVRRYAAGSRIWSAGDAVDYLAVVLDGCVRVINESGGRQHVVHSEGPGGTLGEVPCFTGSGAPATVVAVTATRCLVIPRAAIDSAIRAEPVVAWLFLQRMADRVRLLVERLDGLALQSATARLAAFLLARAKDGDADGIITIGMTQAALAAELGTVREVVVRGLRGLRDAGLAVPVGRGRLRLVDVSGIRRLAGDQNAAGRG